MAGEVKAALEFLGAIQIECKEKRVSCRLQVYTEDDWKKTLDAFSEVSATSWNVRDTYPNAVRCKFHKTYECHHNQRRRRQNQKGEGYKTDTKCPARIEVKIKLINKYTRRNDSLVDTHPCLLIFKNEHNHELKSANDLRQLKLTTETKDMSLNACFESGMAASQVNHCLQVDCIAGNILAKADGFDPRGKHESSAIATSTDKGEAAGSAAELNRQDAQCKERGTPDRNRVELNKRLFQDIVNMMRKYTDMTSLETLKALKKFRSFLLQIKSSSQMNSFYHGFGNLGSVPRGSYRQKIPVQSSIVRRRYGKQRGIVRLGKGRISACLSLTRAQRKWRRNLALNRRLNQGNAKSH